MYTFFRLYFCFEDKNKLAIISFRLSKLSKVFWTEIGRKISFCNKDKIKFVIILIEAFHFFEKKVRKVIWQITLLRTNQNLRVLKLKLNPIMVSIDPIL